MYSILRPTYFWRISVSCFFLRAAVLNPFRLADHLTNFVSVRGPPKMSTFSRKFSEFLTTFFSHCPLNLFSVRGPPKRISPIFPISSHFSGQVQKKHLNFHLQSSCDAIH